MAVALGQHGGDDGQGLGGRFGSGELGQDPLQQRRRESRRPEVRVGDRVKRGDTVVVIEAMKMENEFKSTVSGTVTEVRVRAGQAVNPGDVLVLISAAT